MHLKIWKIQTRAFIMKNRKFIFHINKWMMQSLRFEHVIQLLLQSFRLWVDKQVDKLGRIYASVKSWLRVLPGVLNIIKFSSHLRRFLLSPFMNLVLPTGVDVSRNYSKEMYIDAWKIESSNGLFFIFVFIPDSIFSRELRLMDVLDNLCERMKLYRARPGPEFPYIKGGLYIAIPVRKMNSAIHYSIISCVFGLPTLRYMMIAFSTLRQHLKIFAQVPRVWWLLRKGIKTEGDD